MKRREFLVALGGAVAWPLTATAQSGSTPRPGATKPDTPADKFEQLLQQAKELGAPVTAIQRAATISRQPAVPKKDAFAVFDLSQPSANKRFYLVYLKSGEVAPHSAATV